MSSGSGSAVNRFVQQVFTKDTLKYVFTTHFWGPVSNFGLPLAAIVDLRNKTPDTISGGMTGALIVYSAVFMRYALAVSPKNYLLFGCHFINEFGQLAQGFRFVNYNYMGGKEAAAKGSIVPK